MYQERITNLVEILEKIKKIIEETETDASWSRFNNEKEVIEELNDHIRRLEANDFSKLEDLKLLFAPTASLQEISISSGWSEVFLELSTEFDYIIKDLA